MAQYRNARDGNSSVLFVINYNVLTMKNIHTYLYTLFVMDNGG